MTEKLVLAYSGGLDTSVILHWLKEKGYDVIAFTADLGQKEDFGAIREKAKAAGASKVFVEDVRTEFVTDYIFPAIRANAMYEGRYLLGTSLARPLTAKKQIEIALREGATAVAHGATGKGNDQVRFELAYHILAPGIKIIAPWKDEQFLKTFQGRSDAIDYAQKHGIPVKAKKDEPWSTDPNLMHISYEAGELEDPARTPRPHMFELTVSPHDAPDTETKIEVTFEHGNPVRVENLDDGTVKTDPLELFIYLNDVGGKNAIGREDMVENRFVGIKSRGVYETPAGTILHKAHRDLEGITMDREVMRLRDSLIPEFAKLVYNGMWFSPEMDVMRVMFDKTQEHVSGKVKLALYKGNVTIHGRESHESLYDAAQSSMDVAGGYNPLDAKGFIRVNAIRLVNHALRKQKKRQGQ
ncbi:MAG: argininosuccinate synthase [Candidatus Aenigmarchaeota archaeon]|nr:argininosuccinate synthase [Candidatus Aenigmarchaeota archaeon]